MDITVEEMMNDYQLCQFYGYRLSNNQDLCLVCYCDETEEGKQWDRYKTKCGHVFHTRCFRKWCAVKNCLNCSFCGDIPEIKENRYCYRCNAFGHSVYMDKCDTPEPCFSSLELMARSKLLPKRRYRKKIFN